MYLHNQESGDNKPNNVILFTDKKVLKTWERNTLYVLFEQNKIVQKNKNCKSALPRDKKQILCNCFLFYLQLTISHGKEFHKTHKYKVFFHNTLSSVQV